MKLLSSKKVFGNSHVNIYANTYQHFNGKTEDFYVIGKQQKVVGILAIDNDNNVILVSQFRWAVQAMTIDLPGGNVDVGETPLQAAKRELAEETGYGAKDWQLLCKRYLDSGQKDCIQYLYTAKELTKVKSRPSKDNLESLIVLKRKFDKIAKMVLGTKYGIAESSLFIAVLLYLNRNRPK